MAATGPWRWFRYLAQSESGYLLIETDAGIVTINPHAARERVAYERLLHADTRPPTVQTLLIPETVQLIRALNADGYRIPESAITVEECADAICAAVKGGRT